MVFSDSYNEIKPASLFGMAAETGRKLLVAVLIILSVSRGLSLRRKLRHKVSPLDTVVIAGPSPPAITSAATETKTETSSHLPYTVITSTAVPPPQTCSTDVICAQLNVIAGVVSTLASQAAVLHQAIHLPGK
jgi:hypothetical protein